MTNLDPGTNRFAGHLKGSGRCHEGLIPRRPEQKAGIRVIERDLLL